MEHDTAGDPMTGLKWTHKTTQKIADELDRLSIVVSAKTVGRLLKDMKFSLRVNRKTIESGIKNPPTPKDRDRQFRYIKQMREAFAKAGNPVISVDSKKRELVGNFKNGGQSWEQEAMAVKDHDFPSDADGVAVLYGIYSTQSNLGDIYVGTSHDTPAFAVRCITDWWRKIGSKCWTRATELLVLADSGGSNSSRSRVWKYRLQNELCNLCNISVTICHYPPGSSKWNPIEHRLFAEISKNWAGQPLISYEKILKYLRTTKTKTGLRVGARMVRKQYLTGERVSDQDMKQICISNHDTFPKWNYTISPVKM
jgi:hypothetical protein